MNMQRKSLISVPLSLILTLLIGIFLLGGPEQADAQDGPDDVNEVSDEVGTAFTYQGRLTDNGNPANGEYDFVFELYDAEVEGAKVGQTVSLDDVDVVDGYFSVQLDFGHVFIGASRWLEVGVRSGTSVNNDPYTQLNPRRLITPSPYSIHSDHVSVLSARDGDPLNAVTVDDLGRVGIGTTQPVAELVVRDTSAEPDDPYDGGQMLIESSAGQAAIVGADVNNPWLGSFSDHDLRIVTGNREKVRITTAGRMGIGTTQPSSELVVHDTSAEPDDPFNGAQVLIESSAGQTAIVGADVNNPWLGSFSEHDLRIVTGNREKVRVTTDGRVGIGINNPMAALDVNGQIRSSGQPLIRFKRFQNLGNDADELVGISYPSYFCTIGGWSMSYDINENDGGIYAIWTYVQDSEWRVRAEMKSHSNDHENPDVDVICFHSSIASWDGPGWASLNQPD